MCPPPVLDWPNATNQRNRTEIPATSTSLCHRSLFRRVFQMFFLFLLLAIVAALGFAHIRRGAFQADIDSLAKLKSLCAHRVLDLCCLTASRLSCSGDRSAASALTALGSNWVSPGPLGANRLVSAERMTVGSSPQRLADAGRVLEVRFLRRALDISWSLTKLFTSGPREFPWPSRMRLLPATCAAAPAGRDAHGGRMRYPFTVGTDSLGTDSLGSLGTE